MSAVMTASLLLPYFVCTQPVLAANEISEADEEDVIELELYNEDDVAAAEKEYGKQFTDSSAKLKVEGNPSYFIPFLKNYTFQSLDLEMGEGSSDLFFELSDGTDGYLSEVSGLEKLAILDYPGIYFNDAGVFPDLKELSLTEEYASPYVFGRASSESLPSLETMKVYFRDKDNFDDQTKRTRGLFFPETLKTLELYENGSKVNADTGVWARLFAPLLISCPDVVVNGKTLQEIKAYNDQYGYAFFEKDIQQDILESLLYKTYSDVVNDHAQITEASPVVGGKLVFMLVKGGEIRSVSSYDNELMVPEDYLAAGLDETDIAVILYDEAVPSTSDNPYAQTATKAIITDVRAGIIYPVQTVVTDGIFNPQTAVDNILGSYDPSFRSSGTMTCRSFFKAAGIQETLGVVTDEMVQQILGILNNDVYRVTMDFLKAGEVVMPGTTGAPTAGVQQTLWDLGCPVGADGNASAENFQALNNMLAFYGKGPVDKVDAEVYAQLLGFMLLAVADRDTAYNILSGYFTPGENSSEFEYTRACALYMKGDFGSARAAFLRSGYKDYEAKAKACAQPLPPNGEYYHNGNYYSDAMILTFTVNSYDPAEGILFEVYTPSGVHVSSLFVNGSGSVSTSLPGGVYRIRDISGTEWYGWTDLFGPNSGWSYMTFYEFEEDKYATDLPAGYEWTISINVESNPGGSGVGSTSVPWDTPTQ